MNKTLTYPIFAVACLVIFAVFVTAQNYLQLATAIVLYPALVFLAFMIFPRHSWKPLKLMPQVKAHAEPISATIQKTAAVDKEKVLVADIDRRTFIKLIGATGISFFLVSILGRQVENLIFGRNAQSGLNSFGNVNQPTSTGSPTDGYKISEIDEGQVSYFGFINKDGGWLVMREDDNGASFRYASGKSDFPRSWENREKLSYDYFNSLSN